MKVNERTKQLFGFKNVFLTFVWHQIKNMHVTFLEINWQRKNCSIRTKSEDHFKFRKKDGNEPTSAGDLYSRDMGVYTRPGRVGTAGLVLFGSNPPRVVGKDCPGTVGIAGLVLFGAPPDNNFPGADITSLNEMILNVPSVALAGNAADAMSTFFGTLAINCARSLSCAANISLVMILAKIIKLFIFWIQGSFNYEVFWETRSKPRTIFLNFLNIIFR